MPTERCGVCAGRCAHGEKGGEQFCVFCLRAHGDHLEIALEVLRVQELEWAALFCEERKRDVCTQAAIELQEVADELRKLAKIAPPEKEKSDG